MSDQLKPCPFCGSEVVALCNEMAVANGKKGFDIIQDFSITCESCDCVLGSNMTYTLEEAVDAWNKRAK